jgi:hypothetical protein
MGCRLASLAKPLHMLFARFDRIATALLGTPAGGTDGIDEPIAEVARLHIAIVFRFYVSHLTGPQCGADLIGSEYSEHFSDHRIRNAWSCEACGYQYEDTVYWSSRELAEVD